MASSVLILDREPAWRRSLCERLRPYLLKVHEAESKAEAQSLLRQSSMSLALIDADVMCLHEFADACRQGRRPALIVTTATEDYKVAVSALRQRAVDVFLRPIALADALRAITEALEADITSPHYLGRRIDRYLRENCTRSDLSLAVVSREFGISKSYVSMLLRDGSWGGFRQRLTRHRVAFARGLLEGTRRPLYEIAEQCGFSSASRLSETFSRVVGVSPKKYRIRTGLAASV